MQRSWRSKFWNQETEFLRVEHPYTILAMENLAATLKQMGKYMEAENIIIQALKAKSTVPGAESPHAIVTVANAQEAQDTELFHAKSIVPKQEISYPPAQAALQHTIMNSDRKGV
jgi:hypothetical protein